MIISIDGALCEGTFFLRRGGGGVSSSMFRTSASSETSHNLLCLSQSSFDIAIFWHRTAFFYSRRGLTPLPEVGASRGSPSPQCRVKKFQVFIGGRSTEKVPHAADYHSNLDVRGANHRHLLLLQTSHLLEGLRKPPKP